MDTDRIDFDTWSDELDWSSFNEKGNAILRRRFIKGDSYLTLFDDAPIVAEGITAFLYSNTYYGGLQLEPLHFHSSVDNFDIKKYFQQYFAIRKKFYLLTANSKPDSVHKNLEKEFILNHIKQENSFYEKHRNYFESIKDENEKEKRKNFVESYLKWIKAMRNPLRLTDYLELTFWVLLCLSIVFFIILELFWTKEKWNFVQLINKLFTDSDDLGKQIVAYLILPFIGSFGIAFIRIKKILKTHRI